PAVRHRRWRLDYTTVDRIIHLRGFGVADETARSVTHETPFRIGSITKSFTALAVMQLVEAGKVELDAPVRRYLPWLRVADEASSTQMTARHLLNQTSGLSTLAGDAFWNTQEELVSCLACRRSRDWRSLHFAFSISISGRHG
ncbi:MAG: serine hydrolase domain-containing protein, partial [Burkholderiales bacterium]